MAKAKVVEPGDEVLLWLRVERRDDDSITLHLPGYPAGITVGSIDPVEVRKEEKFKPLRDEANHRG